MQSINNGSFIMRNSEKLHSAWAISVKNHTAIDLTPKAPRKKMLKIELSEKLYSAWAITF